MPPKMVQGGVHHHHPKGGRGTCRTTLMFSGNKVGEEKSTTLEKRLTPPELGQSGSSVFFLCLCFESEIRFKRCFFLVCSFFWWCSLLPLLSGGAAFTLSPCGPRVSFYLCFFSFCGIVCLFVDHNPK